MIARRIGLFCAILALVGVLAACGGGTPTPEPTSSSMPSAAGAVTANATVNTAPTIAAAAATAASAPAVTAAGPTATPAPTASAASGTPATASARPSGPASPAAAVGATPATPAASGATRYAIVPDTSTATYKVGEVFINQGNAFNLAQGSTGDVSGDIFIDKARPSASRVGTIKVDISKLKSDQGQRDSNIRDNWLESAKYPIATFVPKRLEGLPDTPYQDGQELTFKIIGDMTIRTVTKEVTFDAKAKIVGDTLTGTATWSFNMTDFGFDPPSILFLLKAENGVDLEIKIEARRAP